MIDSDARNVLKLLVEELLNAHADRYGGDLLTWMAKDRIIAEVRKMDVFFRSDK